MNHITIQQLIAIAARIRREPALLIGVLGSAALAYKSGMTFDTFVPLALAAVTRQFVTPA